ncbi:hypothetical protein [Paratractidigestivibacter sp.]|uniref:hypothetical protein n=1 Tax=Paratractidigestivibacter sp. TaxID=2847316 RepID=UPI003A935EDA
MKITEPNDRPRELIDQLVGVWECSVRVSHGFLSGADVERIKGYVPPGDPRRGAPGRRL